MADTVAVPSEPNVTPWYLDKGLWVTFLTPLFLLVNQKFGLALNAEMLAGIVLPIVAYIVMHKWKTATLQLADKNAAAAVAGAQSQAPSAGLAAVPK